MKRSTRINCVALAVLTLGFAPSPRAVSRADERGGTSTKQNLMKRVRGDGPASAEPQGTSDLEKIVADALRRGKTVTRSVPSQISMGPLQVKVEGNRVGIGGKATLQKVNRPMRLLWGVIIKDAATDKVIVDRVYRDQPFGLERGESLYPTFDDAVLLNPGKYKVELRLHEIGPGFDLDRLNQRPEMSSTDFKKPKDPQTPYLMGPVMFVRNAMVVVKP